MSRGMSRAALHVATMRSERPRSDQQYCAKRQNGSLPTGAQQASIRARLSSLGGYGRIVTSKARGWQEAPGGMRVAFTEACGLPSRGVKTRIVAAAPRS